MVTALCFDLDGTLFDDRQYVRAGLVSAAAALADETGVDLTEELLSTYFQRGIRDRTFDVVLEEHGLPTDLVPDLVDAYHANDGDLVPFRETMPTLERLASEYEMGLVTGGTNGREKLRTLGLAEYFDAVIVAPERDESKRQPDPFEAVLAALEADPEDAVFVGDRPAVDFVHPNRLGAWTVRVRTGQYATAPAPRGARPDRIVDSLCELPDVLAGLSELES